jgi:hypothetical protein
MVLALTRNSHRFVFQNRWQEWHTCSCHGGHQHFRAIISGSTAVRKRCQPPILLYSRSNRVVPNKTVHVGPPLHDPLHAGQCSYGQQQSRNFTRGHTDFQGYPCEEELCCRCHKVAPQTGRMTADGWKDDSWVSQHCSIMSRRSAGFLYDFFRFFSIFFSIFFLCSSRHGTPKSAQKYPDMKPQKRPKKNLTFVGVNRGPNTTHLDQSLVSD